MESLKLHTHNKMHELFYLIFNKERAYDSWSAIKFAKKYMKCRTGLMGSSIDPYWIGNWFVIGGRWSGKLSILKLGNKYIDAVDLIDKSEKYSEDEKNQKFRMSWAKFEQDGIHPVLREINSYYGDDAALIDKLLLSKLDDTKRFIDVEKDNIFKYICSSKQGICKDYHEISNEWRDNNFNIDIYPKFDVDNFTEDKVVGKKWVVVIDIHC